MKSRDFASTNEAFWLVKNNQFEWIHCWLSKKGQLHYYSFFFLDVPFAQNFKNKIQDRLFEDLR